jgi:ATP synthase I chain
MNPSSDGQTAPQVEAFLSGAYQRIRRITIVLGLAGTIVTASFFGWRQGLGSAAGALAGYLNFVWLHHASRMITERMIPSAGNPPSRFRLLLAFAGRYVFIVATAYVILKSWPQLLVGFSVALFFPIVAAMCEGIYEAFAKVKADPSAN